MEQSRSRKDAVLEEPKASDPYDLPPLLTCRGWISVKRAIDTMSDSPDGRQARARKLAREGREAETQGALGDSLSKLEAAISLLPESEPSPLRVDVLRWLGTTHRELGQTAAAESRYEESVALAQGVGYEAGEAHALNCLAIIAQRRGDVGGARGLYRQAARHAESAGEHRLAGMVEQNLGVLANIQGDLDGALVRYRTSLSQFEEGGFQEGISWVLNNLGKLHTDLGKYQEAEQYFLRALEIAAHHKDLHTQALLESNLSEVYIRLERWVDAELHVSGALAIAEERGDPLRRADGLKFLGMIQRARGDFSASAETLTQSHEMAEESEDVLLAAEASRELGETYAQARDFESARGLFERANKLFTEMNAGLDAIAVQERMEQLRPEAR